MKKLISLLLALAMLASLVACGNTAPAEEQTQDVTMQYITVEEAAALVESDEYVFFDVRKAADAAANSIVGAESWDMDAAKEGDAEAGKATMTEATKDLDKKIIVVCYSGKRYAQATTNALSAIGYDMSKVYTLEGGFNAWSEAHPELTTAGVSAETPVEKQDITIAVSSHYPPFCYVDENENYAGYEYELFLLVGEKLADKYNVEVVCDGWDNLFVGIESGKYDVISHHLAYSAERAEKYTVSTESLMFYGNYRILRKADRTDITDLESLQGLVVANAATDNAGKMLLAYNEEHADNPIIMQETYPSTEAIVAGVANGLYDGYVFSSFDLQTKYIDPYPEANLVMTETDLGPADMDCGTYALLKKGNTELQQEVDAAIKALREEGKIAELCIKWFGADYSVKP